MRLERHAPTERRDCGLARALADAPRPGPVGISVNDLDAPSVLRDEDDDPARTPLVLEAGLLLAPEVLLSREGVVREPVSHADPG